MKLQLTTVHRAYAEFAKMFPVPDRLNSESKMEDYLDIVHRELSRHYDEESFPKGVRIAYTNAKFWPVVADFFSWDHKPKICDMPIAEERGLIPPFPEDDLPKVIFWLSQQGYRVKSDIGKPWHKLTPTKRDLIRNSYEDWIKES